MIRSPLSIIHSGTHSGIYIIAMANGPPGMTSMAIIESVTLVSKLSSN